MGAIDAARKELADDPTVDITTIGRRSGEPRRIEIWMFDVDGRFFITGIPGPRSWLANVHANPSVTVHFKRNEPADMPARAVVVNDLATRRHVIDGRRPILERFARDWASGQDDDDLVANAPMIEVMFE